VQQGCQRDTGEGDQQTLNEKGTRKLGKYKRMSTRRTRRTGDELNNGSSQNKKVKMSLDSREREELVYARKERDIAREERDSARKELETVKEEQGRITKKYEDLVKKLRDKVECPVCFAIPKEAPVPVCPNGHVVCVKCVRKKCPTCRVKMEHGRSTLAVTVIDNIEHQCSHCDLTFSSSDLPTHMSRCGHRIVKCPGLECSARLPLSSLHDHVINCCVVDAEIKPFPKWMKYQYEMNEDLKDLKEKNLDIYWKLKGMKFEGKIFFFKMMREAHSWFMFVQMVGSSEDTEKYRVMITVSRPREGPKGMYSRGCAGNICPIDTTTVGEAAEGGMCLILKDEDIAKLLVKNSKSGKNELMIRVEIFRV